MRGSLQIVFLKGGRIIPPHSQIMRQALGDRKKQMGYWKKITGTG
jgi:hypothetical protein